jgi:hypothetical protein
MPPFIVGASTYSDDIEIRDIDTDRQSRRREKKGARERMREEERE